MSVVEETLLDLALARGTLDRDGIDRRDHDPLRSALAQSSTRVYDLVDGKMRTCRVDGQMRLVPRSADVADTSRLALYLGRDGEREHVAVGRRFRVCAPAHLLDGRRAHPGHRRAGNSRQGQVATCHAATV